MTSETIIKQMLAIKYKGASFVGWVERNNSRNKELLFVLRLHGSMQQTEGGGASRQCKEFISINAVLDTKKEAIAWNYTEPGMQKLAEQAIYNTHYHVSLHEEIIKTFKSENNLKIKEYEKNESFADHVVPADIQQ